MTIARDVAVGDRTFHLLESGDPADETVLWLHGSGPGVTAATNWERVLADLAGDFHHLAPDMIGFGDSTHPDPAPASASAFKDLRVDTLLALLDELGAGRAHLVGNSYGGIVALALALKAPERVGRIVLMGGAGAPVPPTGELLKLITYYDDPTVEALAALLRSMVADPGALGADLDAIAASRMERIGRPEVRRSHLATFAADLPGLYTPEDLARVDHPVLVLHGRQDRLIPLAAGEYFAEHLPDARLHVLPNAGHWAMLEQPDRFAFLTGAFLAGRF
ncbi:alpha/beta fold hydrolase [Actinomadura parmotrematis]|uniref:Alpha/beta fold hydrolase n=1 Tax=Actinomadura parmotrematis TaxID=2864039 RepID=A0ABS7FRX8_9ACTN|nr:alpha/beta fold hydrolase [Actinomadura parmotrematis]MBW8483156.1 alpha/beta fold hydrolase [Actinomadura parmotrematis]